MSGMELVGLAASVIQIADLGGRLSVTLFTFTRKVKNANKNIDALCQELAGTGAVLRQLAETLSNDEHLHLCSQEAITTATALAEGTKKAFVKLQAFVTDDGSTGCQNRPAFSLKQRIKFPFLEPHIDQLRANLERLKSSLRVILNVLIFAELLRNQEALPILKDQHELIRTLAAEKNENDRRYQEVLKLSPSGTSSLSESATVVNDDGPLNKDQIATSSDEPFLMSPINITSPVLPVPNSNLPFWLKHYYPRIQHHSDLVETLLSENSSLRYRLDHGIRDRMHNGILDLHWKEWAKHRDTHGFQAFDQVLAHHEEIARYWTDRFLSDQHSPQNLVQKDQASEKKGSVATERSKVEISCRTTSYPMGESEDMAANNRLENEHEEHPIADMGSTKLEDPWRSNRTHHRRPSIEVTAPDKSSELPRNELPPFSYGTLNDRVRPTVSIPSTPSSPIASEGQTPVSPSEITPGRRLSYERLRSPSSSAQNSPAPSPYLRKATLHSAYASSPPDPTSELGRRNSTKEAARPQVERVPSSPLDEHLLSPSGLRRLSIKDEHSGSIKLKDPLGRKFKCPLQKCSTWEDMHNLIEAQFRQHAELLPEVQANEYDLFLADGQRILIANWASIITPGLRVIMLLRYGNPAAGFRRKDCLISFNGERILAPDMLLYITKQEPHNAYRTKLISYRENEDEFSKKENPRDEATRLRHHEGIKFVQQSFDLGQQFASCMPSSGESLPAAWIDARQRSMETAQRLPLDDVDRLILNLTNITAYELNQLKAEEGARVGLAA